MPHVSSRTIFLLALPLALVLIVQSAALSQPPLVRPPLPPGAAVITLGTPWTAVEAIMGTPKFSSIIPCLGRAKLIYNDGTEIILLNSCVISVAPGAAAHGDLQHGFVIDRPGCSIYFEPAVLRAPTCMVDPDLKCQVERCFNFAPPLPDGYPLPPQGPAHPRWNDDHHHPQPPVGPRVRLY